MRIKQRISTHKRWWNHLNSCHQSLIHGGQDHQMLVTRINLLHLYRTSNSKSNSLDSVKVAKQQWIRLRYQKSTWTVNTILRLTTIDLINTRRIILCKVMGHPKDLMDSLRDCHQWTKALPVVEWKSMMTLNQWIQWIAIRSILEVNQRVYQVPLVKLSCKITRGLIKKNRSK